MRDNDRKCSPNWIASRLRARTRHEELPTNAVGHERSFGVLSGQVAFHDDRDLLVEVVRSAQSSFHRRLVLLCQSAFYYYDRDFLVEVARSTGH